MELTRICSPSTKNTTGDFTLYKGITFRPIFKFKSNNLPVPISGKIITFYIADEDGNDILTIDSESATSNGSTIIITDDANGVVNVLITDEETTDLTFEEAKWWLTLTLTNGDVLLRGKGNIYLKNVFE